MLLYYSFVQEKRKKRNVVYYRVVLTWTILVYAKEHGKRGNCVVFAHNQLRNAVHGTVPGT